MAIHYAHTRCDSDGAPRPETEWEPLYTGTGAGHLEKVAALAAEFAGRFNAADWGFRAGLWHDLGKYSEAYLRTGMSLGRMSNDTRAESNTKSFPGGSTPIRADSCSGTRGLFGRHFHCRDRRPDRVRRYPIGEEHFAAIDVTINLYEQLGVTRLNGRPVPVRQYQKIRA